MGESGTPFGENEKQQSASKKELVEKIYESIFGKTGTT